MSGALLKASAISLGWVSYVIIGIFALCIVAAALCGFAEGFSRQTIRVLTVGLAFAVGIIAANITYSSIISSLKSKSIEDIHAWVKGLGVTGSLDLSWMLSFDANTLVYLLAIPITLILMPIVLSLTFLVFLGLTKILHFFLCGIFGLSKKKNTLLTRFLGLALGAIEGFFIAGIIMLPIIGASSNLSSSISTLKNEAPNETATIQISNAYDKYLHPVTENGIIKALGACGMNAVYEGIATVNLNGKNTNMTKLVPDSTEIVAKITNLKGTDFKAPSEENKVTINAIVDILEGNDYFSKVASNVISGLARAGLDDRLPLPSAGSFNTVIDSALEIFAEADEKTLYKDIDTLLNIYYTVADAGALTAMDKDANAMLDALNQKYEDGDTTINKVIGILNDNSHMSPLVTVIARLSVSVMANKLGFSEETAQAYDNIKAGFSETLKITKEGKSEKEYLSEVSTSIDATLKENGITVEPEVIDSMAKYVNDNFGEGTELTDNDINNLIINYYDSYLEYQESGKLPEAPEVSPEAPEVSPEAPEVSPESPENAPAE